MLILGRAGARLSFWRMVLAGITVIGGANAQDFPARPVHIVVPYAPGGPVDIVTRVVSQQLYDMWKQPVVVDSKPGAGGNIGSDMVAKSKPDGYTLLINTPAMIIPPSVSHKLPSHPFKHLI